MGVHGASLLILLVWMCGAFVHATWFPPMKLSDTEWQSALSKFDVGASYKKCNAEHKSGAGDSKFLTLYKDRPMTFVVVGKGGGNMDIKFKDSNYVFEHKFELGDKYLVIPPYQPVEWMIVRSSETYKVCSYYDSLDTTSDAGNHAECDCASEVAAASSFTSVTFPHTIRKPEQQFFLTAELTPEANDVTICTILTVDRLRRIEQMSEMWGGPISAAVYLHELNEISKVMEWYLGSTSMRRHVDIHIVHDDKIVAFELPDRPFPVNILRNVAIRHARTANVFYIEGDFIPSPDLYTNLDEAKRRLATGEKVVFIVAPFSIDNVDFDMKLFPKDKKALVDMLGRGGSQIKDLSYFNSHAAFKFHDWYRSTDIYPMAFAGGYEPYYIGPKSYPLFEEIFIGCGADKVSHPSELNSAGYKFNVLPQGFIVHIDSTGMGSAWCRGWAGNARSTMKWEAFTVKTSRIYNAKDKLSFDSRIPWWDLAPVAAIAAKAQEDETCAAPPPKEKECPTCSACPACPASPVAPGCPPPTKDECAKYVEEAQVAHTGKIDDTNSRHKEEIATLKTTIQSLRAENEELVEYSKFVVNLGIGVVVVMVVVVGVGVCVWPRNKKVWVLPSWKATHHNL
eukprot:Phypoly_transcript_04415.p1 GENE.Phypoly_transcript_04415~~Phypoly_transcript_04415.p1  ORF type:complete len:623 (+),score=88.37 Phypoly_transcript_04415:126-1994(+)